MGRGVELGLLSWSHNPPKRRLCLLPSEPSSPSFQQRTSSGKIGERAHSPIDGPMHLAASARALCLPLFLVPVLGTPREGRGDAAIPPARGPPRRQGLGGLGRRRG